MVNMDSIPSSPVQIYRGMLILEESLRAQYVTLRTRRYKYMLFCTVLMIWTAYFYYGVFVNYSVYTSVHLFHKLCLTIGIVTLGLFYISGQYSKTMVYPRRFLPNTNKGLRQFNLKLVSTPTSTSMILVKYIFRLLKLLLYKIRYRPEPPSKISARFAAASTSKTPDRRQAASSKPPPGKNHAATITDTANSQNRNASDNTTKLNIGVTPAGYQSATNSFKRSKFASFLGEMLFYSSSAPPAASPSATASQGRQPPKKLPYHHYYYYHDKPPGGDLVKLVMIPKAFSPEIREGWEVYRQEYWEQENERRAARASGRLPCHCTAAAKPSSTAT